MAEEKFDAIVIGAGLAGCAAAYKLAKAGLEVVVIERGQSAGSKNLSGGAFYTRVLHELIPNFWEEAPVERYIIRNIVTFMTEEASFSIDFRTQDFAKPPYNAFSVLRAPFDQWLAGKAEEAGAMMVNGIRVDQLLKENDRVVGIVAGEETMRADVVIAADGANSFMAQQAGLRGPIPPEHMAVGVKELIGIPRTTLEDRFGLEEDEGVAYAIDGYATRGVAGGGFMYTNKESISIGIVMRLNDLLKAKLKPSDVMEDFLAHPMIAPLVKDGKLLEYGAHLVVEGGLQMMPKLYSNGILVTGDAAGFGVNSGLVVRGMDLAVGSGMAAADTIIEAKKAGDFSSQTLSSYAQKLEKTFVLKDMRTYAKAPSFMENKRLYTTYPELANSLMENIFTIDGTPKDHLMSVVRKALGESGVSLFTLANDAWKGVRAL